MRRMPPPPGKEVMRGGPNGLSTLHGSSEARERTLFLRSERNLDMIGQGALEGGLWW